MLDRRTASLRLVLTAVLFVAAAAPAGASTTGSMPWDNILSTLADSATGTVISALVTIGIVVGGIYWFLTDSQRGLVNILKAVIVAGIVTGLTAFLGAFGISMATV
jgi:type IV secretory pathway VirB2 component (pilin)